MIRRILRPKYMIFAICLLIVFQLFLALLQSDSNKATIFKKNESIKEVSVPCNLPPLSEKAYARAKTPSCRNLISKVACLNAIGVLDVGNLPQYCPIQGDLSEGGQYLSCHRLLHSKLHQFNVSTILFSADNSPQRCVSWCRNIGLPRALLFQRVKCLCVSIEDASHIVRPNSAQPDQACMTGCPRGANEFDKKERSRCGSRNSVAIYDTLVKQIPKSIPHMDDSLELSEEVQHRPVRIVYLLILNGRAWRQVKRLIKAIYHVNHYFYIHVDKRANYLHDQLQALQKQYGNIRLTTWRMSTIWGGASLLDMVLKAMADLLSFTDWHWDFIINLSESDFPIRSNSELVSYLSAHRNKNFLKFHGQATRQFLFKQGFNYIFVECDNHLWLLDFRNLPGNILMSGGSDWIVLNRRFVEYAVTSQDELVWGLKKYFKYSLLPVESFFHTVIVNSAFCTTIVDNHLHFINWKRDVGCQCQHKDVVDWCGCSPNVLRYPDDRHRIAAVKSNLIFFARKFDPIVDLTMINYVEDTLRNVTGGAVSVPHSSASYWENIYSSQIDDLPPASLTMKGFLAIRLSIHKKLLASMPRASSCYTELARLPVNLLNVEVYYRLNHKIGLLISTTWSTRPDTEKKQKTTIIQTLIKLNSMFTFGNGLKGGGALLSKASKRILEFEIGVSCDAKESMFRDHTHFISPDSVISARFKVASGDNVIIYLYIFGPQNRLVDNLSFQIVRTRSPKTKSQCLSLTSLKRPLKPGFWTVQTYLQSRSQGDLKPLKRDDPNLVIQSQFLVLPQSNDIEKYIDIMWLPRSHCAHHSRSADREEFPLIWECLKLDPCHLKSWSSYYPDPRTELGNVNPATGYL